MGYHVAIVVFGYMLLLANGHGEVMRATCEIAADSGDTTKPIVGTVKFTQMDEMVDTTIEVNLSGFDADQANTKHGFHIHTTGDLGDSCKNAGGHYNPLSKDHAGPNDTDRHVGDLGNVMVNGAGKVFVILKDSQVKLSGPNSVLDRSIVVHAGEDDLGRGGETDSKTTGHAGGRWACCKILKEVDTSSSASHLINSSATAILLTSLYILF